MREKSVWNWKYGKKILVKSYFQKFEDAGPKVCQFLPVATGLNWNLKNNIKYKCEQIFKAVGAIMSTLIFPLFTGLLYIIVTVWFAATAAYIATSATPIFQIFNETENGYRDTCDISQWENPDHEFFNDTNVFCGFTKYQGLKQNNSKLATF